MRRLTLLLLAACANDLPHVLDEGASAPPPPAELAGAELPVGAVEGHKADGTWGAATTCKALPEVAPLADPLVVISLDGLTLHLTDRAGDYDRVFPIGPGAVESGVSLTPTSESRPEGVFWARLDQPAAYDSADPNRAMWAWNEACRIWWTDETGKRLPVFAGLPFIRLEGPPIAAYALHGPIDQYTAPNGGELRRGLVSHGCVRMQAADILEVYGRLRGKRVPVRIQKAIEQLDDGTAIDVSKRWVQSECALDSDCGFAGAFCKRNPYSGRGFCTRSCTGSCPDLTGFPTTRCVADPEDASKGICVLSPSPLNAGCRRFDGFVEVPNARRFGSTKTAPMCLPGSEGWIGDPCFSQADCGSGRLCRGATAEVAGLCTQGCTSACPDQAGGFASTFCVADPAATSKGTCLARCSSNDDCGPNATCEAEPRFKKTSPIRTVCLPL